MPKKGEKMSVEQREKIAATMREKGAQHTLPAREALQAYRTMAHQNYRLRLHIVAQTGEDDASLGDGAFYRHSPETKAKISATLKRIGHQPNAEARSKLLVYNRIRSDTKQLREKLQLLGWKLK